MRICQSTSKTRQEILWFFWMFCSMLGWPQACWPLTWFPNPITMVKPKTGTKNRSSVSQQEAHQHEECDPDERDAEFKLAFMEALNDGQIAETLRGSWGGANQELTDSITHFVRKYAPCRQLSLIGIPLLLNWERRFNSSESPMRLSHSMDAATVFVSVGSRPLRRIRLRPWSH